jgi:hypothetical protein
MKFVILRICRFCKMVCVKLLLRVVSFVFFKSYFKTKPKYWQDVKAIQKSIDGPVVQFGMNA